MRPVITPKHNKLRIIGYCSGSGNTLWSAYKLQKEMEAKGSCPFEVAAIFADNPESKAVSSAMEYGVAWEAIDIRAFYSERNAPMRDRTIRTEYDRQAMALLEKYDADVILLAGYVWATTDIVLDTYTVVNVHPADLAVTNETGTRLLAGSNGIKSAFKYNMNYLRASSHLATKALDAGPLLVRSPQVPVDYTLFTDEEERFRHYLKLVNAQSRKVGARTMLELAEGNFSYDDSGRLLYKGALCPTGLLIEEW